jgi:hypothetical protein
MGPTPASFNKHFLVNQPVQSFYTGREEQMEILKMAFEQSECNTQKRFIIFGLGGSGKTELALKYAQDHTQKFWGIFWVDGSSRENAVTSYVEIAKVGGVEANLNAAKHWLSSRNVPWLLIIDNINDDEVQVEELIPAGTNGCVLLTTRNPAHKSYGTVGDKYMGLLPMKPHEANELILRAAKEPIPWAAAVVESAESICEALGFLPLALVHAAKAILNELCSWSGYLSFYERSTQRIRHWRLQGSRSRSGSRSKEDDDMMNVFSSYEILYQSLESSQEQKFQDAIQLLQIFSFFHFQNIRLDIFIRATLVPLAEVEELKRQSKDERELERRLGLVIPKSWSTWLWEVLIRGVQYFESPPTLPAVLKNQHRLERADIENEIEDRLRAALSVLVSRSLVMKQDRLESRYSMHPLIHKWVRNRPETSTSQ